MFTKDRSRRADPGGSYFDLVLILTKILVPGAGIERGQARYQVAYVLNLVSGYKSEIPSVHSYNVF